MAQRKIGPKKKRKSLGVVCDYCEEDAVHSAG